MALSLLYIVTVKVSPINKIRPEIKNDFIKEA